MCFSSLRAHFATEACFERHFEDVSNRIIGYFHTTPIIVTEGQPPELEQLITTLNERVEQFPCCGSGYVLSGIRKLTVVLVPFLPLGGGSSYIPTPEWLAAKKACINVKVYGDRQDCFKFAVLSALFPVKEHSDRMTSYLQHENAIDCSGLKFPVAPEKIHIFERNNPSIAIHCLAYNAESDSFTILYLSPEMHIRKHNISLLLLDSCDGRRKHYVWIKKSLAFDRKSVHQRTCASRMFIMSASFFFGTSFKRTHAKLSFSRSTTMRLLAGRKGEITFRFASF